MSLVTDVSTQGGRKAKLGPTLIKFGHGKLKFKTDHHFKGEIEHKFNAEDDSSNLDLKVTLDNNHLKYDGNFTGGSRGMYRTFLAVKNKSTKKIRLVEANELTLEPILNPPPATNPKLLENLEDSIGADGVQTVESRSANKKHLVQNFGQLKGKRMYEQADRMKVDHSALEEKLAAEASSLSGQKLVDLNQSRSQAGADTLGNLIPPCNRNAIRVQDVYDINSILTKAEIETLATASEEFRKTYPTAEDVETASTKRGLSGLFAMLYKRLADNNEQLGIALYLEAIVKLLNLREKGFQQGPSAIYGPVPLSLKRKIFSEFTVRQRLTPETRDRAICYVLVLSLLLHNYSMDMSVISDTFKKQAKSLKQLIAAVGATVQSDIATGVQFLVLKLPLAYFSLESRAAKKRKSM